MRTFDRYLLSQLVTLFGFFSLVLVAVYWVNRAVSLFDRLVVGGQDLMIFLEFTALALPNVIVNVLPVSALVALIYGVNRLHQDSELVVAQTSGLGPWALGRPVVFFGVFVALLVALLAHVLVPTSRDILGLRGAEVSRDVTARFLTEGEFLHPAAGITVYVRNITETGQLEGLFLEDRRSLETKTIYTAERAYLFQTEDAPRLVMLNGVAQTLRGAGQNLTLVQFDDFTYDLGAIAPRDPLSKDLRTLSTPRLLRATPADQDLTGASISQFRYEAHVRFADPLFAGMLPLLALAIMTLGRFSRFGLWRQILATVLLAIMLQMLGNVAKTAVLKDAETWALIYAPPLLTLALGVGILLFTSGTWRARGVAL